MLSCREMSERASELSEGRVSWRTRAEAGLHWLMCRHCRRYLGQIRLTMQALRRLRGAQPPASADRILQALERRGRQTPL